MAATIVIKRGAVAGLPSGSAGEPLFTTDQFRLYVGSSGGNRLLGVLDKIDGTTAPTVNEDAGDGFSVDSVWCDTTNDKAYICLDSTVGAAVWQQFSGTGTGGITQLTGNVTAGPGSGSQVATIANAAVTLAKIANASANSKLIGSGASGSGASYSELTLGTGLSMSGTTLNATGGSGTVTTVGSADGSVAVTSPTTAPDLALNENWLQGRPLIDGYFVTSVGSSALTFTLKNSAGNTPSAAGPVKVVFPGTAGAAPTTIAITAATTFVVSSGSKLGAVANIAFRVWLVGFNDAGTFRLGAICIAPPNSGAAVPVVAIADGGVASSTAEGGAGAADDYGTIYTGTAVASKQYRVLGYATWEAGLGVAGTWGVNASDNVQFGPGVPLPGSVIQSARLDSGGVATGTTTIPLDNTIPQNTEGDQYMSLAFVPTSAANKLWVTSQIVIANSTSSVFVSAALFKDSVASALRANFGSLWTGGVPVALYLNHYLLAGSTASQTFKVRAGANAAGTTTINGQSGAGFYGGVLNTYLQIDEVMG